MAINASMQQQQVQASQNAYQPLVQKDQFIVLQRVKVQILREESPKRLDR